jgi:hypothetical protein
MSVCETCGNDYAKAFTVNMNGEDHTFDSFECAISALAPVCENCGTRVIGHGIENEDRYFCSAHCAGQRGVSGAADNV